MENHFYVPSKCPKHKGEYLKLKTLIIKTIDNKRGVGLMFEYCEKSNKYFDGKKLVEEKEIALQMINNSKINKKKYSLEEITITMPRSA